jgi:hypothetical protein
VRTLTASLPADVVAAAVSQNSLLGTLMATG